MRAYFSLATLSLIIRVRASVSFDPIYCTATYPAPTMPKPNARLVRCRLTKLRVDSNMGKAAARDDTGEAAVPGSEFS